MLEGDKLPPEFEDQTLEAWITGDEPATQQFSYSSSLYLKKNTAVTKCQLLFVKEGCCYPIVGLAKHVHDKPTIVRVQGENNCYIHSIVYL